jgi:hypothetical protein
VTSGPEQPYPNSGGNEYPPLENSPQSSDPYAPVEYPTNPGLPPPVYGAGYPGPAGYPPQAPGYPPPQGFPPPPGYPAGPPGSQPYAGGYAYGTDPYDPYRAMKPQGTNGMAIASLVTSVLGLVCCIPSVIGMILGIIAMRETKRTGQDGFGLALAGTIVGGLITVGLVLYLLLIFGLYASDWSYV